MNLFRKSNQKEAQTAVASAVMSHPRILSNTSFPPLGKRVSGVVPAHVMGIRDRASSSEKSNTGLEELGAELGSGAGSTARCWAWFVVRRGSGKGGAGCAAAGKSCDNRKRVDIHGYRQQ